MTASRMTVLLIVFGAAMPPVTGLAANLATIAVAQGEGSRPQADLPKAEPTPQAKMAKRWPQPARVGDLVGRTVVDDADSTIGHVRHIARTPDGKVEFIVSYGGLFGWGSRLVAVPVEAVAMIGPFVAPLDFKRGQFDAAPTWFAEQSRAMADDETVQVGIARR